MGITINIIIYVVLISLSIFQYIKYRKLKRLYLDINYKLKYKHNFLEILDILEKSIDKLLILYHNNDIIKQNLISKDNLSTEDYIRINKDVIKTFINIYPKEEILYFNKMLNNNLIHILGKIIHKKLLMLDSDLKLNFKKIIYKNMNDGDK